MADFQRERQQDDFSIQSYNFGGLNTTASRLNVPFSDATELINVDTALDGSLLKRKGTRYLAGTPSGNKAYGVGVRSVLGYNYSCVTHGTNITVYSRTGNDYAVMRDFSNVYTSTPANTSHAPVQWVQLPDVYSRILALREDRPPVEVYLLEQRVTGQTLNLTNQIQLTGKFTGDHQSVSSAPFLDTIYVTRGDGTKVTIRGGTVNYTYNAGSKTITITLPFTTTANEVISYDVVGFRWCWWAESIQWQGDRFYDTVSRFNVTASDNNVKLPESFTSDYDPSESGFLHTFLRTASGSSAYSISQQPTTADQYGLSEGAVYTPGVDQFVQPGLSHITFGTTRLPLPQPPESVKISRFRELRFNNNTTIQGFNLRVTVNDVISLQNTSGSTAGVRQYFGYTPTIVSATSVFDNIRYIGFTGSYPAGIPATDIVTMTNAAALYIQGSIGLEVEESVYRTGAYRRAYGLGLVANYGANGVFPSVGCVYQGRLVLSGISTDKSKLLVSGVDPTQDRYSYFQITDDLSGLATDPFDIIVSGGDSADYIVGLVEWNSSLFALTRRSVYRISGGDQPLTALRRFVTYISNIGLVNPRCITRTDTAVYYLSDGGVFNLTPRVEDSEFAAIEKSLKVRSNFLARNTRRNELDSCMYFDSKQRRLYVALPNAEDVTNEASDVYVLDTVRDAWTTYRSLGQLRVQSIYENVDNATGSYGVVASTGNGSIVFDDDVRYTDNTRTYTGSTNYSRTITVGYAVPSVADSNKYDIPRGIPVSTIGDVRDLRIFVGTTSPVPVTFTKSNGYVYLDTPTVAGTKVWFVARSTINDSPQGLLRYGAGDKYPYTLWVDNVPTPATVETLTFNNTTNVASLQVDWSCGSSQVAVHGVHYFSSYVSSLFTQQLLGALKRTKYAYLYFNNSESSNYTTGTTVEAYVTRINANVAMMYDSDDSDCTTSTDIYGYEDIVWDNAYFDTVESSYRQDPYALFKEPLIGVGYSYRLNVYSYDDARWHLVGYQIDASQSKGLRYINSK